LNYLQVNKEITNLELRGSSYSSTELKYVIALGYFKLGQNKECLRIVDELLLDESDNQQFLELKRQAKDAITRGIILH
jgi:hypothetical protein